MTYKHMQLTTLESLVQRYQARVSTGTMTWAQTYCLVQDMEKMRREIERRSTRATQELAARLDAIDSILFKTLNTARGVCWP